MRIGIDIMGGDFAPEATTTGAIAARKELPEDVRLVLIGDEPQIRSILEREQEDVSKYDIVHTTEVIGMDEHPTRALPQKPQSSIAVGFRMLKEGNLHSFASAGNTGAMLVGSIFSVNNVPGVIRPCITSILPKFEGGINIILDVGSNADCKPDVLYQFAVLGSIYIEQVYGVKNPKVGLLNIGEEPEKGNLLAQSAHALMKDSKDFNFIGNVEGRDLFRDKADVIVCDGFTGNVALKEAEGLYWLLRKRGIRDEYFDRFNYENYGGTPVLGVNSNVIIGHGISNATAIKNMILLSKDVVNAGIPEKIKGVFAK
ncbi:MAG: phosphate acyltransferase PlsX [Flavobacteriales bacterium]|nr:phosphate acyltransferase PlsX [Flavobacteriales bacterium]